VMIEGARFFKTYVAHLLPSDDVCPCRDRSAPSAVSFQLSVEPRASMIPDYAFSIKDCGRAPPHALFAARTGN
jgi:hypothetical protein